MKKKLLILPLIAAGIGAHYFAWNTQTTKLADGMTKQIEKLNVDGYQIAYDARKISGYPAKSVVTFTKPTLKSANGTVLIEGDLTFEAGLLGDKIEMIANGAIIVNDGDSSYKVTSKNGLKCSVAADSIVDFIAANENIKQGNFAEVAKNIRHVGCKIEDFALNESEKTFATAKSYNMSFNSSPASGTTKMVDFSVQMEDFEMNDSASFARNIGGGEYGDWINLNYKNLGKQDFVMSGGAVFDSANSNNFQFNMREFKVSNDLYDIDFPLEINNDAEIKIAHTGTFNFNEKFDAANIEIAKNLLADIKAGKDNSLISNEIAEKIKGGAIDEAIFINSIPQLQKYSKIQTYVNMNGAFAEMKGKFDKIGFSTPLFALIASGETSAGNAEIEVNCQNCETLVKTFANYANDVAKMLHATGEMENAQIFSNESVDGVIKLLSDYDSNNNDKDVTWKISKKGEVVTISDKKMEQFMQDFNAISQTAPALKGL